MNIFQRMTDRLQLLRFQAGVRPQLATSPLFIGCQPHFTTRDGTLSFLVEERNDYACARLGRSPLPPVTVFYTQRHTLCVQCFFSADLRFRAFEEMNARLNEFPLTPPLNRDLCICNRDIPHTLFALWLEDVPPRQVPQQLTYLLNTLCQRLPPST